MFERSSLEDLPTKIQASKLNAFKEMQLTAKLNN